MSDNLKAASLAAGLSPEEQKKVDDFNKAFKVHKQLSNVPPEVGSAKYNKLTSAQQANLQKNFGNEDPLTKPKRGFFGTTWDYTGGALLKGLAEVSDFTTRAYRTAAIAIDQDLDINDAWTVANDKGDKVFSPDRIATAQATFGRDAVDIAVRIASGEDPEKILKEATPEQKKYLMLADPTNKVIDGIEDDKVEAARGLFQDTLDAVQAAKYSPGRQVANAILPVELEGSGFF